VSDDARLRATTTEGVVIAAAIMVMNVTTYGLTVAAAHLMGPVGFGEFSAVMGILMVLNVLALGLQATGARRVAVSGDGGRERVEHELRRAALRGGAGLAALTLLAAPLLRNVLDIESWLSLVGLAVAAGVLTVVGALAGLLQGEGRWRPLAAVFVAIGVGRLGLGVGALAVHPSTAAAMVGVALGTLAPLAVGWVSLARGRPARPPLVAGEAGHRRGLVSELAHSTHALLAFFVLSNIDIVIARAILPERATGLFAGGLIITKAVTFLPQFVIVIAFPAMARRGVGAERAHALGLVVVGAIGVVATVGVLVLPGLAELFVGGSAYAPVTGTLWLFALVGTVLACVQFLVYGSLALEHPRAVWVEWAGVALFAVVGLTAIDPTGLVVDRLWTVALLAVLLAVVLLPRARGVSARRRARSGRPRR
jgi:O-antigen/teichoic acid export membrane protein